MSNGKPISELKNVQIHDETLQVTIVIEHTAEDRRQGDGLHFVEGAEATLILLEGEWETLTLAEIGEKASARLESMLAALAK